MGNLIDGESIVQFHDRTLNAVQRRNGNEEKPFQEPVWHWIAENHKYNYLLWNEENKARGIDVADAEIVACKRLIDRYNQKRNDAIEAIDEALLAALEVVLVAEARLHSETAGAMIDRLSILGLKIFHMREQALRTDVGLEHIAICEAKLQRLLLQRYDLCSCLNALLDDAGAGRAYFKIYRQFKMYNDPMLNPYLYAKKGHTGTDGAAIA